MKLVVLSLVVALAFGSGVAHASRTRMQSNFVANTIQRMAHLQTKHWGPGLSLAPHEVFGFGKKLEKNLGIAWDWERAVENLFSTFEPDKLDRLAKIYGMADNPETISKKKWLHRFMVNGNTEVADKMVEMGLDLNKVDLQGLLVYALQPNLTKTTQANWWEWLLKHGASMDDPQLITQLFKRAALENDVMLLDWMKNNLFVDTDTSHEILALSLNEALPFAVRTGATEATVWLLKHGANTSVLKETDLLRAALRGYLVDTGGIISLPLAQHVSDVDESILAEVLYMITRDGVYKLSQQHIFTMKHLQNIGTKLTSRELQETLWRSLTWHERNWMMANWAIAQGADINALDLNKLISIVIKDWWVYLNKLKSPLSVKSVNIDALFDFLRMHGFDHSKLDVAQLLSEAEEKNCIAAIAQLNKLDEQVENISAAEVVQQLYKEVPTTATPTYAASDNVDFLLHSAIRDYLDKKSFVWLFLYIGKVRGVDTTTDKLMELVRLIPYEGLYIYNEGMDRLIATMGLAEQKAVVAQEMLSRLFQSKEKHPFPLSFARWAVASGADINQLDRHAVVRTIINNAVIDIEHGGKPYRDNKLLIPSRNDIFLFLQRSGFHFDAINQQHVQQEAEARGVASVGRMLIEEMR